MEYFIAFILEILAKIIKIEIKTENLIKEKDRVSQYNLEVTIKISALCLNLKDIKNSTKRISLNKGIHPKENKLPARIKINIFIIIF